MNPLLQSFLQESREALGAIGDTLLAMERNPDDEAQLVELFRLVHTLKGNSGLFDFPALTAVLHAAEDLMDGVRNAQVRFSQALADQLLEAVDYVSLYLDEIEAQEAPGTQFQRVPQGLVDALRGWLVVNEGSEEAEAAGEPQPELADEDRWQALPEQVRQALREALAAGREAWWVRYEPAADCFFQGTDPLHLVRQLPDVLWRQVEPREQWACLAELDAYACNLRFQVLALSSEATLAEHFRYVAEQVRWQPVSLPVAGQDTAVPQTAETAVLDPLALEVLRAQQAVLSACREQTFPSGAYQAVLKTLENVLSHERQTAALGGLRQSQAEAARQGSQEPVATWLEQHLQQAAKPQSSTTSETVAAWLTDLLDVAEPPAAAAPVRSPAAPVGSAAEPAARASETRNGDEVHLPTSKVLKVEQEKIDRLMNLIGEIVVAKNGLPYLAERAENQYGQREMAREIKAQYAVINRIAEDLHDAIMQVRMMPVSFVLQRFPRLVRDISRKLGKKINLVLEGEETEADKAMIEALADPLVHMVRNALDHGLESPEERRAAGKPETGTVRIRASQNGDHVLLAIEDDGRGIDPRKIRAKVLEKGLVDPEQLEAMSEQEIINLVFLPGFSTAEKVSDLSGRGVGMDVVRTAIEKVGGHLKLSSQLGKGTQLSLALPLSMAVTKVMVIESAGQRFGVPMDQVMETVRLPESAIHTLKHQPTAQLRGRTIPLNSLNSLLAMDAPQQLNEDGEYAVMVLRNRGELAGLLIDDFHGSVDILLKPMAGILGEMSGYAGTAVMGDGSILMVLNPAELFA